MEDKLLGIRVDCPQNETYPHNRTALKTGLPSDDHSRGILRDFLGERFNSVSMVTTQGVDRRGDYSNPLLLSSCRGCSSESWRVCFRRLLYALPTRVYIPVCGPNNRVLVPGYPGGYTIPNTLFFWVRRSEEFFCPANRITLSFKAV